MSIHPDTGRDQFTLRPEGFTRTAETLHCWCYTCNDLTEHAVSDGRIGRCVNSHANKKDPRKAAIPEFSTLRKHLAALDGAGNRGEK
jgi:hypothetical protein